jgi:hypothetical protein
LGKISTRKEFAEALESLSLEQQRIVAARFVADVIDLTDDERVKQAQRVAADRNAAPESLMLAYHAAWHAAVESSVHSDMEPVDWHKQTAHFVAKACAESLAPAHHGIAWRYLASNVANHCHMARLCASIEHEQERPSLTNAEEALNKQIRTQFDVLSAFLEEQ